MSALPTDVLFAYIQPCTGFTFAVMCTQSCMKAYQSLSDVDIAHFKECMINFIESEFKATSYLQHKGFRGQQELWGLHLKSKPRGRIHVLLNRFNYRIFIVFCGTKDQSEKELNGIKQKPKPKPTTQQLEQLRNRIKKAQEEMKEINNNTLVASAAAATTTTTSSTPTITASASSAAASVVQYHTTSPTTTSTLSQSYEDDFI